MSAALPHPDEQPPAWESLDIDVPAIAEDEKIALEEERKYYEQILAESQTASQQPQRQRLPTQEQGFAV